MFSKRIGGHITPPLAGESSILLPKLGPWGVSDLRGSLGGEPQEVGGWGVLPVVLGYLAVVVPVLLAKLPLRVAVEFAPATIGVKGDHLFQISRGCCVGKLIEVAVFVVGLLLRSAGLIGHHVFLLSC